jgi:hypothetical protein
MMFVVLCLIYSLSDDNYFLSEGNVDDTNALKLVNTSKLMPAQTV